MKLLSEGVKYLFNKEYCYLFHLDTLSSWYNKMMQQTSIDIMAIGNMNPSLNIFAYRIRPAPIYFISLFHKMIWNNMKSFLSELKMLRTTLLSEASILILWQLSNGVLTCMTLVGFKQFSFVQSLKIHGWIILCIE